MHSKSPALDLLPSPFEWVHISEGKVILELAPYSAEKLLDVHVNEFLMSKYPITNAQYLKFIEDTGQMPRDKRARERLYSHPVYPVSDLLWVEAMTYCKWLSDKLDFLVTLPSVAQWQYAAQGHDRRKYPWGDLWDKDKCNCQESQINHTTSVVKYPEGTSPFGVMDLLGNTCEWTLTNPETGTNDLKFDFRESNSSHEYRIAKGAHYYSSTVSCNVTNNAFTPIFYSYGTGIRLVTDVK